MLGRAQLITRGGWGAYFRTYRGWMPDDRNPLPRFHLLRRHR